MLKSHNTLKKKKYHNISFKTRLLRSSTYLPVCLIFYHYAFPIDLLVRFSSQLAELTLADAVTKRDTQLKNNNARTSDRQHKLDC